MKCAILSAAWLGLLAAFQGQAIAQQGDERIIAAREALRTGQRSVLETLAARPENHPLEPYVEFWRLTNMLARTDQPPDLGLVETFLRKQSGSLLAERLRDAWIRRMAEHGDWRGVVAQYPQLAAPDQDARCHWLNGRVLTGDRGALDEALEVWAQDARLSDACRPVLTMLVAEGRVGPDEVWRRIRVALENNRRSAAVAMAGWLPGRDAPSARDIELALSRPARYLDRLPVNFSISRRGRELAIAALAGVAREDAAHAHYRFQRLFDRFKSDERAHVYADLGWRAAEQHRSEALAWYRAAGEAPMGGDQRDWHVRAALRAGQWKEVRRAIEMMPEARQSDPAWVYWLGRALREAGDDTGAVYQFARIADGIDFYGLLAAEELGRGFTAPGPDAARQQAAQVRADADPGLQRALALFRLDMRTEGVREWNWALRDRDDAFLLAAAALAAEQGIYDRAINTAERLRQQPGLDLRYLAPYRELIEPQAKAQGLDLSWVYGLMRQESRFVPAARSSAGAQGLMQVMPATGRWVARKIGVQGYNLSWLQEPENNVMIGTSYMRMIMDDLDHHPVLASAGYNAGPGRARSWRDARPLEGAIYAETIPFDETRDYVKKVMANAVVYGALFDGQPQSLKQRLGTVNPAQ